MHKQLDSLLSLSIGTPVLWASLAGCSTVKCSRCWECEVWVVEQCDRMLRQTTA